jgi:4-hydroxy-tetrahydrodipicolinate synthase
MLGEVLTAIVTPFDRDGRVDLERFRALASFLVDNGSDGIVVSGTTGEAPTLSDTEKFELFEAAVDVLRGRASVVAGVGTYDTAHSIHLTKRATEIGVDGLLVVTPYYSLPPQRGIVAYNIPSRVVRNIEPETIERLAEIPTVRAVKQANADLDQARQIPGFGLDLYAGDDNLLRPFLDLGAKGVISVHAHVAGAQVKELIRLYREGDPEAATQADHELGPAYDLLKVQTNPIAIKAALNLLGHDVGGLRLPLVEADDAETAAVRDCLERLGVLQPASV